MRTCKNVPTCTAIVDDNGISCYGRPSMIQYELRRGDVLEASRGRITHLKTECSPPPPPKPPPSWPMGWKCFEERPNVNLPEPLTARASVTESERCKVRYNTLEQAKIGCVLRSPDCAGIVDDEGITCGGVVQQYELRMSEFIETTTAVSKGATAWLRAACPPAPPSPSHDDGLAVDAYYTMSIAGGISVGGVALLCVCAIGVFLWFKNAHRLREPPLLRGDTMSHGMRHVTEPEAAFLTATGGVEVPVVEVYEKVRGSIIDGVERLRQHLRRDENFERLPEDML